MRAEWERITADFTLQGRIAAIEALGEGFINDTFIIRTEGDAPDYILQRKNRKIFPDVPAMMENIRKVTDHIRRKVAAAGGDTQRGVLTIVPTRSGALYHRDAAGEYWVMTRYIAETVNYDRADTELLARMGGIGIGQFHAQLADFNEPLAETIPGFHNIRHRFRQWDASLVRDAAGRAAQLGEEIAWIEARRAEMLAFWEKVEQGEIPTRVTHNDTKITNILFNRDSSVCAVIDLDTVMNSTALNDFGDAIRTCANTGAEDDRDLERVRISAAMFAAYTDGYLSEQAKHLTETEIDHLVFGARYIIYEQVLRFLMDYIDGDTYYKIKTPDHNLVRTHAQRRLVESLEEQNEALCRIVATTAAKYR